MRFDDGREVPVAPAFMGAEGRYEDWMYLDMLEHEWKRPVPEGDRFEQYPPAHRPSPQAVVVLLFWTYLETKIERLLKAGLSGVPEKLAEDALSRYSSIAARTDRFYKILFGTTYADDLTALGYGSVAAHIAEVHRRRNEFAHGHPQAIDDALVRAVVEKLKDEHEAWIAVFNRRGTTRHRA